MCLKISRRLETKMLKKGRGFMKKLFAMLTLILGVLVAVASPLNIDKPATDIHAYASRLDAKVLNQKEKMKLYLATDNYGKNIISNHYVAPEGMKQIEIPESIRPEIKVEIKSSKPLEIYSRPAEIYKVSTSLILPNREVDVDELEIYNNKFLKIKYHDQSFFIDVTKTDLKYKTDKKYKIIGEGYDKQIISADKNVTLEPTIRTNLTVDELRNITYGTGLEGIEHAVVEAEERYGVNALFILAVAVNESGWGNSYLADTKNNLFGIAAYDSNIDAAFGFSSKSECINYFGQLISEDYFDNGLTDVYSINSVYASSPNWAHTVNGIMSDMSMMV
jgi:beta-N-acetylglucosaminidase